jgi:hypothetical protein
MKSENEILEGLVGDDIIYHYTTMENALHYILDQGVLRFSPRAKMIDPIENMKPMVIQSYQGYIADRDEDDKIRKELSTITEIITKRIKEVNHICFCRNNNLEKTTELDYYGCFKPKMWDNYGQHYKGVCLVFSKSQLTISSEKLVPGKVEYINYGTLRRQLYNVDYNRMKEIGIENYKQEIIERTNQLLLHKHKDYEIENEYRIMKFSNYPEEYLKFNGALKAIITSWNYNHTSNFAQKALSEFAKQYHADLLYISWNNNGISVLTENKANSFIGRAKEALKTSKK